MERYVFETAKEMVRRGHQVAVLCGAVDETAVSSIDVRVIALNPQRSTRGWQNRYFFRNAVTDYFTDPNVHLRFDIIHSHENTVEQHITTEHGPCTARGLRLNPWKHLDFSARKNLAIERLKFSGPHLKAIVSCAERVQEIIIREYPHLAQKITKVITPAHTYLQHIVKNPTRCPYVLGFIGRDWKRKGLPKALEIFSHLRAQNTSWTMLVAGCPEESLPSPLSRNLPESVKILGRIDPQDFFGRIDVLVHPANDEPFGMVVSESLTCGVPVVCSDQCGAAFHLRSDGLRVLRVDAPLADWTIACSDLAGLPFAPPTPRTWADVAADHENLYDFLLSVKK